MQKGLAWVKYAEGTLNGPVAKFLTDLTSDLTVALQLEDKDLVLFVADTLEVAMQRLVLCVFVLRKSLT